MEITSEVFYQQTALLLLMQESLMKENIAAQSVTDDLCLMRPTYRVLVWFTVSTMHEVLVFNL